MAGAAPCRAQAGLRILDLRSGGMPPPHAFRQASQSMDDKDRVFSRFQENKPAASDRRELLTIPRRAGAVGSRVVEVVHVRAAGAARERPRRPDAHVRAASWEGGFPARQAPSVPAPAEPPPAEAAKPTAHVMPAWEPAAAAVEAAAPAHAEVRRPAVAKAAARPGPTAPKPARRVADPFDTEDDGANCMRCGYAIEPEREMRGLLTCARCA